MERDCSEDQGVDGTIIFNVSSRSGIGKYKLD
jgi:hypothetical protein